MLTESQARGAIGPGSLEEHAAHATGFLVAAEAAGGVVGLPGVFRFLDLGSGGGLPGLVMAAQAPLAVGMLLDGRTERARWLETYVGQLGWADRLEVCAERAERAGREARLRGAFDLVVARGFGPPPVTVECAAPFLVPGGLLVVSEPPDPLFDRWPPGPLAVLGLELAGPLTTIEFSTGVGHYQVFRQVAPCPERWPRRVGVPAKRPLYTVGPAQP